MTQDDLKQIEELLDRKLEQKLEQKFDQKLQPITDKLDLVYASCVHTESVLKGYADSYKANYDKCQELDERVSDVEQYLKLPIIFKAK